MLEKLFRGPHDSQNYRTCEQKWEIINLGRLN